MQAREVVKMLGKAILILFVFGAGFLLGIIFVSVLSANTKEEEQERAYILGYRDCMQDRPPRIQIR